MGSGFTAINIGDEIIEINNQVVVSYRFCNYKIFRIQMKGPLIHLPSFLIRIE
jgi:hypothetical protein